MDTGPINGSSDAIQNNCDLMSKFIQDLTVSNIDSNRKEILDKNLNVSTQISEVELNVQNTMRANGCIPNGDLNLSLTRERLESTSLVKTPVMDGALQDFHQHKLIEGSDPFSLKYNLYAVVVGLLEHLVLYSQVM